MIYIKYLFGLILAIPLLPLLYLDGKNVRKKVPKIAEAKEPNGLFELPGSSKTLSLITIGESSMASVGVDTHQLGFTGSVVKTICLGLKSSCEWSVYAQNGFTLNDVRVKLLPKIEEQSPEFIVVGIGGNDGFHLSTPWMFKRNLNALIDSLLKQFPQSQIIFCNTPPIKDFPAFSPLMKFTIGNLVEIFSEIIAYETQKYNNVYFAKDAKTIAQWKNENNSNLKIEDFFSDGVHPSRLTYTTWGKEIGTLILNIVKTH